MKNFIILVIVVLSGYYGWQHFSEEKPAELDTLYEGQYVVVYGREKCGMTTRCIRDLNDQGLEPIFQSVDNNEISDELHSRMELAGLDTRRYNLPVIDVNGNIYIRPELSTILEDYENFEYEIEDD